MGQWTSINSGTTENLVYITFPDSLNGYIIGGDWLGGGKILLKTSDGGYTWNQILNNYEVLTINFLNQDTGIIFYADSIPNQNTYLMTIDGGINWTSIGITSLFTGGWTDPWCPTLFHMFTADEWMLIYGWYRYTTNDGGNTWQTTGTSNCLKPRDMQIINDSTIIACGSYGDEVFKSMDRGYNWITIAFQMQFPPNASIAFTSETVGFGTSEFVSGEGRGILKSIDGGVSWNHGFSDTTVAFRCIRHIDENTLYAVGDTGTIVKTNDAGGSWSNDTSGSTMQLNEIIFLNNKTIVVGDSGTILMNTNISANTGLKGNVRSVQYVNLFPNPTNDLITLDINGYNGSVQTQVYDLSGRLLQSTNNTSISLKDYDKGIYLFRVNYGDRVEELKVVKD